MGHSGESRMTDVSEIKMPNILLQSKDHEELLNSIDKVRSQGIGRYVDLPQIIVCGDQSAGKSSVLEAVSGLRFPTKDNLCTRFATELILRRSSQSSITVTILPDINRSKAEKKNLVAFKVPANVFEELDSVIEAAGKAMGLDQVGKVFSTDVLRVEVCGPTQPHLTLVDLPGLFHAGNKTQSDEDAASVKTLVTGYMKKSRSIILAVVSAKNDYANQIVTKYAKEFDPNGERTMGIITKPDTLHAGSDSERHFFELAENKDVYFRLKWHVLKNRDYNSRDCTSGQRDQAEEEFFSKGIWTSLSPMHLGIRTLKPRLSRVLTDQILVELPGLIRDVQAGIDECKGRLSKLGGARNTLAEQRMYLHKVANEFSELVKRAVNGYYEHDFFGDASAPDGNSKRLRAIYQNTLSDFAKDMQNKGHLYKIVDVEPPPTVPSNTEPNEPTQITRASRISMVSNLMKRDRGTELPGTYKPDIIGTLFREESKPWRKLVTECADTLFEAARTVMLLALEFTADQTTKDGILRFIINPNLEHIKRNIEEMIICTLKQHSSNHPITFNHYLTENIQKARETHNRKHLAKKLTGYFGTAYNPLLPNSLTNMRQVNISSLLDALVTNTEAEMNDFAASEALDCMLAYYKVAMKYVIDDFAIHTMEECLMQKLGDMFTTTTVIKLDDALLENIAGETEDVIMERASSNKKKDALEATLKILLRLDRHNSNGKDFTRNAAESG